MNLAFRDDQQANAETHNQARASRLLQCKRHDQRLADWSQIRSLSDATAHGNQECIDIVSPFRLCQQHCDTGAESLSGLFEAVPGAAGTMRRTETGLCDQSTALTGKFSTESRRYLQNDKRTLSTRNSATNLFTTPDLAQHCA